jgi:hypothetical protein
MEEKKEELYSMVFYVVSKYRLPLCVGRQNRLLLERLSGQVQPRPNDLYWYAPCLLLFSIGNNLSITRYKFYIKLV